MAFEAIRQLTDRVAKLDEGIILNRFVELPIVQKFILDLNRVDQLFNKGVDSKNRALGVYTPFTINSKNERGVPVPSDFHITLFDTGQFYSTFVIIPGKDFFEIDANPIREDSNLFEDFGEDILGLNDENLQILIDFFKETVVLRVKEQLRLL
mgnify:FL=1|jgi:hypothetical protein|tara:strand:- start:356 stop:814 length:459 start_codon:yes stop_codon:yes gene_type:complete